MVVQTGRFGPIEVSSEEIISIPSGVFGFPEDQNFCLVDSGDDTLILWLQSLSNPHLAFPVLEPKIFKTDYIVRLSAAELRELRLSSIKNASVFTILTIPADLTLMTANLKAPLVINIEQKVGKQVVLQENDQPRKFSMFKELRAHLTTMPKSLERSQKTALSVSELPTYSKVQTI